MPGRHAGDARGRHLSCACSRPADGTIVNEVRSKFRVMLVDDHAIVREGLRAVLAGDPGLEVVAEACDGLEGCELAAIHQPDVVIMDVSMPRLKGQDATRRL